MKAIRWVAGALGLIIAINLVALGIEYFFGAPSGPTSSGFSTTPRGIAAMAELLERTGHRVDLSRVPLADADLDPSATLVLFEPQMVRPSDQNALGSFVEAGGRLVAGGRDPEWLQEVAPGLPTWTPDGETVFTNEAASTLGNIHQVETAAEGSWLGTGSGTALLGDEERPLVVSASAGNGTIVAVADASAFQNQLLARADNAGLALTLVDGDREHVVFAEAEHGYRADSGLAALPRRWKLAMAGLVLAAALWMWSKGRRLGPPEDVVRTLPPPRVAYVEALAATLARTEGRGKKVSG
jgi:hypothetical protein